MQSDEEVLAEYNAKRGTNFVFWPGGDGPPTDWDGGPVARRRANQRGGINVSDWGDYSEPYWWQRHASRKGLHNLLDIIGYTRIPHVPYAANPVILKELAAIYGDGPWQPIETAPKHGKTSFIAWGPRHDFSVVFWEPSGGDVVVSADGTRFLLTDYWWKTSSGSTWHRDCFTHWLPLPTPPTS